MYKFYLKFYKKRLKSAFVFYFSKGMNLKILGIDPGSRNCGYAIIEADKGKNILIEAGLIKIKPSTLQYQITELCEGLDLIFKNHSFDEVAIEDIFFAYNPKTVLKLAQFRGALSLKISNSWRFCRIHSLTSKKSRYRKSQSNQRTSCFYGKKAFRT